MPKAKTSEPELIIQVEHYPDLDPRDPVAYKRFLDRMAVIHHEYGYWQTIVLDSLTFFDMAARNLSQYKTKSDTKKYDNRHWGGDAAMAIREVVMQRFSSFPCNVGVTAHIDTDKDEAHGRMLRHPAAPGTIPGRLPSAFGEVYVSHSWLDDQGQTVYGLQTERDTMFNAATQIPAPNYVFPDYQMLWSGTEDTPYPIHCLTYGDSGSGKSSFLATFPKPMLVLLFDPPDKARPYYRQGIVGESYTTDQGITAVPVFSKTI